MIRDVLTIGDERLLKVSTVVTTDEFNAPELDALIADMHDTLLDRDGVGLAAIQIGYAKRILLIGYDDSNPRYADIGNCPLCVIINPEIETVGYEMVDYNEGCLSVPDQRGLVTRPKHIRYKYYDQHGRLIEGENDGFFARVFQHEVDHLNGILFPMRVQMKNII